MVKFFLHILILFSTLYIYAQEDKLDTLDLNNYIFVKPGDSVVINLKEIQLLPKPKFKSKEDLKYYRWLQRRVFKVYPFAVMAAKRLDTLNNRLERIPSKRKQKHYVKLSQKYLEDKFTAKLKKLTKTEGRLLVKLIYRQTGKTAFTTIKEFRSGWRAFWYNTTATFFKLSLKEVYNPATSNEDFLVEGILQTAFKNSVLEEQVPKIKIDYLSLLEKKTPYVDVSVYKTYLKKLSAKRKKRK